MQVNLNTLGGSNSYAYGINDLGQVVGIADDAFQKPRPFLWENGVMKDLSPSPIFSTVWTMRAINNHAEAVGDDGRPRGFIWRLGKFQYLNDLIPSALNWDLRFANAINDKGQIIGTGALHGVSESYLLTPVPQGDVNGDGRADDFDLAAVIYDFGAPQSGSHGQTDLNQDGIVNDFDLATVIFNFGH